MVFDVHSHSHQKGSFTELFEKQAFRMRGCVIDQTGRLDEYQGACKLAPGGVRTIVFGGKAKLSGVWTSDHHVAKYCAQDPEHLIPFLSVDPTQKGWREELTEGHQDLKMRGIKLLPIYAGFYPQSPELDDLWAYASRNGLPVLLHTGTTFVDQAPLEYTLPRHLDTVAIKYPECRIILAHMGHPYEGETVAVIRKHPNVYADISALWYRPFQFYHSLMLVQEYGVWNKLLFGTDYPVTTVDETICGLRHLNEMLEGTALPRLKSDEIEKLIQRDAGSLLQLA
jgi:predicted TIM-barrel fold metal-dependent hydrolase